MRVSVQRGDGRAVVGHDAFDDLAIGFQIVYHALEREAAVFHDRDAFGGALHVADLVRREHDGVSTRRFVYDEIEDRSLVDGVEAAGRLVEHQHFGGARKGEGDRNRRAHALGKFAGLTPQVGNAEAFDEFARAVRVELRVGAALHLDVFGDAHPLIEHAAFGNVGDAIEHRGRERLIGKARRAAVGAHQAEHAFERRGLAGAVGPQQAEDAALRNRKRKVVERHEGAVRLAKVVDRDRVHDFSGYQRSRMP